MSTVVYLLEFHPWYAGAPIRRTNTSFESQSPLKYNHFIHGLQLVVGRAPLLNPKYVTLSNIEY